MILQDIHTHHLPLVKGSAVVNSFPTSFVPESGMWYSVGFHPWMLKESLTLSDWKVFEDAAAHSQVLAIGEAGLDKLSQASLSLQIEVFERQARWAEQLKKPLIIHLVKATDELLKIKRMLSPTVPWIIHGFRGKVQQMEELIRHGFYLSFGEKFHEESLRKIPHDRLFLETDESRVGMDIIIEQVAEVRGCTAEEIVEWVRENIRVVFFKH